MHAGFSFGPLGMLLVAGIRTIEDLPDELLDPIFEFLPTSRDKSSVSLVCRWWHGPGQRALFRDVDVRGTRDIYWLASSATDAKSRTRRLQMDALAPGHRTCQRTFDACESIVSLTLEWTTASDESLLHHRCLTSRSPIRSPQRVLSKH